MNLFTINSYKYCIQLTRHDVFAFSDLLLLFKACLRQINELNNTQVCE